ncbi:MAG: tetratricopeptide repeat protein [Candidatus Kapabacteria bacterium]|nr:tetratricopeptide repeat protein [Candidatus Kapabacteria bacterium]
MGFRIAKVAVGVLLLWTSGCQLWWNAEAYFNTYYNMRRLMSEVEEEFGYYDETRRVQRPRVIVPDPAVVPTAQTGEVPPFLQEFVIDPPKLQPVTRQLDSILQKGSKILAFRSRSDFVDDALFLMAQAFFYRSEWLPAQIKCQELLQLSPKGDLAPDAQLLLAKAYLMQRKVSLGQQALSRAIDIAWYRRRYDVLSEAFRLLAELALSQGDVEAALRPYRQAMLLAPDGELRARWQFEIGAIYYRLGRFAEAEAAFAEVLRHSPSVVIEYEAQLYRAAALARSGRFREADQLLSKLKQRRRYEQWSSYTIAQELALRRLMKASEDTLRMLERRADSAFPGNPALLAVQYEHALQLLQQGDYRQAQRLFARASVTRSPVFAKARDYSELLVRWERAMATTAVARGASPSTPLSDSLRAKLSDAFYDLGRVHSRLGNQDSARYYYDRALQVAPDTGLQRPRALFALASLLSATGPSSVADSLLEELVACCPKTPYGREAQLLLGYTPEAVVDTAAELYESGLRLWRIGEHAFAREQWRRVVSNFSTSPSAPQALYALGWSYEHGPFRNTDSALMYYQLLVERYPETDYAADVRTSVTYARVRRGAPPSETSQPQQQEQQSLQSSPPPAEPVLDSGGVPPIVVPSFPAPSGEGGGAPP